MLQKGQVLSGEVRACEGGECGQPGCMVKLRILKDWGLLVEVTVSG